MKNPIPLLKLLAFLPLMFPLSVFADVIDGPSYVVQSLSQAPPVAIIIMVALLVIVTILLIRRFKKN